MKNIVIGLWLSLFIFHSCKKNNDNIALYINDEPIKISEMEFWISLSKAEVYSYFFREYNVDYSPDFWMDRFGGESPMEMLKNVAMQRLVKSKVQQLLARDLGVIEIIDYDELMAEKHRVNQKRKMSQANGEPIYGPIQFSSHTYFDHVFDKMVYKTRLHLLNTQLYKDSADANGNPKSNNGVFDENEGFYQMQYIDMVYHQMIDERVSKAKLIINNDVFDAITLK